MALGKRTFQQHETYYINYKEGQGLRNNILATLEGRGKIWKPRGIINGVGSVPNV